MVGLLTSVRAPYTLTGVPPAATAARYALRGSSEMKGEGGLTNQSEARGSEGCPDE